MGVIWRKVWRDVMHNRARTFLVVLSTAVGVASVGLVFGLSGLMRARMTADHRATVPPHVTLWGAAFTQDDVDAAGRDAGVAKVEGETSVGIRWKREGETEWRNGTVIARPDYAAQRIGLVNLIEGQWPGDKTLGLERQSSRFFGFGRGAQVIVQVEQREERLTVAGLVRMSTAFPPQFGGEATFFATPATVQWLAGVEGFTQIKLCLRSFSKAEADSVAACIEGVLEERGRPALGYGISDPNVHWMQDTVNTLFLILGILGALSLGLSAFLIVNTLNAIMAQQVWQIGIMKVIGATFGRVVRIYLAAVLTYSVLALLIAIPAGAALAHELATWLLGLMNIDIDAFHVVAEALLIQLGVGLAVPLLATLPSVVGGARISAYRAISSYGLGAGFRRGWLEQALERIRSLPRPLALSLRSVFRHRVRVSLTLFTLTLGGVIFIMVMSVNSSLDHTLEVVLQDFHNDIVVAFDRPQLTADLVWASRGAAGVTRAEAWDYSQARLSVSGGEQADISLWALPLDSQIFTPRIVAGRGLQAGDDHAILLNRKTAADEHLKVGDRVTLTIGGRESTWEVVGLVLSLGNNQRDSFVPLGALAQELGTAGRATMVMVEGQHHDAAGQQALARELRVAYEERKIELSFLESTSDTRSHNRAVFDVVTYLMLTMAVLAAIVSSIGLMGAMSINVVERRREIGVLRALGASSAMIVAIFVTEGVLVGALSWLLAVPLSQPGARLFSGLISEVMMPLDFSYSSRGALLWLGIVLVLSIMASLWPALHASDISVREALAYE